MKFRKLLAILCVAALCGCSSGVQETTTTEDTQQQETVTDSNTSEPSSGEESVSQEKDGTFADYLNEYVVEMCEESYITLHNYFSDPEAHGIDVSKAEITLGHIMTTDEEEETEDDLSEKLESFDYESLDDTQKLIYDQMQWEFDLYDESCDEKYDYIDNIWSSFSGQHQVLVTFFSEYELYSESDIEPLITLINDVPRYVEECIEYSQKQAEMDLLYFDYDSVLESIQEVIDTRDDSAITGELDDEVDNLGLEEAKAAEYKEKIHEALNSSFFPAYETMKKGLEGLKDKVQKPTGLANLKNGMDYYEILAKDATGSDVDPAMMKKNMSDMLSRLEEEYYTLMTRHYESVENADSLKTDFKSVEEIMTFLNGKYAETFPEVETMNYNLQALADEQSQQGIVAYFLIPTIDYTGKYQIRYNQRDYGTDPTDLSLYQTLAHEGIPGHMYQTQYVRQHYEYDIQYMLSNAGFSEGYATYVETQSLQFLDLDTYALQAYNLNNVYSNFMVCKMDIDINYYGMSLEEFSKEYGSGMDDLYYQLADNPTAFLSYYYGYYMILSMRNEARSALGDAFNDIDFNNALLSCGEVNFSLIQDAVDAYIESN